MTTITEKILGFFTNLTKINKLDIKPEKEESVAQVSKENELLMASIDEAERRVRKEDKEKLELKMLQNMHNREHAVKCRLDKIVSAYDIYLPSVMKNLNRGGDYEYTVREEIRLAVHPVDVLTRDFFAPRLKLFTKDELIKIRESFKFILKKCVNPSTIYPNPICVFYSFEKDGKMAEFKQMVIYLNELKEIMKSKN